MSARARGFGLGIAILGTGQAARTHGRNLARWFPGVRRWTASRCAVRAGALAASTGATGHFGSYEEALAEERVDAVSESEWIEDGTSVKVVSSEGYRHVVRPVRSLEEGSGDEGGTSS